MNLKKIVLTTIQYLFFAFFVGLLLISLSGAKTLSQELLENRFYRELIQS